MLNSTPSIIAQKMKDAGYNNTEDAVNALRNRSVDVQKNGAIYAELVKIFNNNPNGIILISGPGGKAFDEKHTSDFTEGLIRFANDYQSSVGNGKTDISLEEIGNITREATTQIRPLTFVIDAHGDFENGKYCIQLSEDTWTPIAEIYTAIKNNLEKDTPITIFLTSCHGAGALDDLDNLPDNATVVVLSKKNETTAGQDVDRFVNQLGKADSSIDFNQNGWLEATEMLYLYLTTALENRISPDVGIKGKGKIDLSGQLMQRLGKPFSNIEKDKVFHILESYMNKNEIARIIECIETSKSEWGISAKDYGKALAVILAIDPRLQ